MTDTRDRITIWCATIVALLLFVSSANAQRLTGIARDTGSVAPLSGVVVVVLDANRIALSRAITGEDGRYSVDLPASATQLRVVRIGYQPRVIALATPRAARPTLDFALTKVGSLLSTRFVNDDRICSTDRDRTDALSLWEQARAALLASIVARESHPSTVMNLTYERVTARGGLVLQQATRLATGRTTRPFVAADAPAALAEQGYLVENADGRWFKGPDADVLLDDSFAATHCFSVQPPDAAHPGAIGLGFEPARGRERLMDVRGTLWMESTNPSLRSLEYRYTGGDPAWERAGAAGAIYFRTMPNGVVFVDEWKLHIPVMQGIVQRGATNGGQRLPSRGVTLRQSPDSQIGTSGGVVLSASWPDDVHWQLSLQPLFGAVQEEGTRKPIVGALIIVPATGDTVATDSLGRFEFSPWVPGRYRVTVIDTSLSRFIGPRSWSFETTVGGAVAATLGATSSNTMSEARQRAERLAQLEVGDPATATALRHATQPPIMMPSRDKIAGSLCGSTPAVGTSGIIMGRVTDTTTRVRLPRDAKVTAAWLRPQSISEQETQTVELDDQGRFSICGVPYHHVVLLMLNKGNASYAEMRVLVRPDSSVIVVDWPVDARALERAVAPKAAVLVGRVTRSDNGGPIAGADIWLPALDRHATTDSSGRFRLNGLSPGRAFAQARSIGYRLERDTLTLGAGVETRHDFVLTSQATLLDTNRTVASPAYASPALRGFEERRARQVAGYFVADSALRREDGKVLGSVILSRVSGMMFVPGKHGETYMVSSRKQCSGRVLRLCESPDCYVTVYMDGVLYYSVVEGSMDPPDVNRLQVRELSGLEFYPSGGVAPPEYNATGAGCGTLLLWTRER
ncbi:MAG: carboxypeptidase regulatory-like domain-containing protein [Gemmatimonadota bacterium]